MNITQQKQHGFSLIELMVALLIGLFLMGGVISVYLSSSQSSRVNEGLRTLQENGRFALTTLREGIQMGGYLDTYDPTINTTMPFPFGTNSNTSLSIAFEGTIDCAGNTVTAVDTASGKIIVQNVYSLVGSVLRCTGNGGTNSETIVEGIDSIRILYGLDDNNDKIADRYVLAADVAAADWTDNVNSIRIALLMNSIDINVKQQAETESHQLLDTLVTTSSDRLLHKVFTTTILLRNRMS